MTGTRAPIFDDESEFDLSSFKPKPTTTSDTIKQVAEQVGFRSREPGEIQASPTAPERRAPRRYRTGRNVQFNLKVRQDIADAFYLLADQQGWVLGYAFERALQALERELKNPTL